MGGKSDGLEVVLKLDVQFTLALMGVGEWCTLHAHAIPQNHSPPPRPSAPNEMIGWQAIVPHFQPQWPELTRGSSHDWKYPSVMVHL